MNITHDRRSIDWSQVRRMLAASYWVPGIPLNRVHRLADNSFLVAALVDDEGRVYAYARAVSDGSRFAYMADVIVHPEWRGRGYGKRIVGSLLKHPKLRHVDQWLLQTHDAQTLYARFGFHALEFPERVMVRRKKS